MISETLSVEAGQAPGVVFPPWNATDRVVFLRGSCRSDGWNVVVMRSLWPDRETGWNLSFATKPAGENKARGRQFAWVINELRIGRQLKQVPTPSRETTSTRHGNYPPSYPYAMSVNLYPRPPRNRSYCSSIFYTPHPSFATVRPYTWRVSSVGTTSKGSIVQYSTAPIQYLPVHGVVIRDCLGRQLYRIELRTLLSLPWVSSRSNE